MFFILSMTVLTFIYISNFKQDFTQENIDKVTPVLVFIAIIVGALLILSCIF